MTRPIVLPALLSLLVCACARGAAPTPATPPAPPAARSAASPASASSAPLPQDEAQQATAAQEQAGEEPAAERGQDRGDAGLERLAQLPADQQLPGGKWKAGVNYDPLVPAQPTNVAPGKVEVVEVFWLGCPHCYALEPYIQSWLKNKPAYDEFVRVPVMWGPVHRAHAHLFYTLVALNRQDLLQKAFDAIQQQHQMLAGSTEEETYKAQENFAKANGISPDQFSKAYNSFSVSTNLQRAEQLTQRYHVEGVPLFVIDGKYTTDVAKAGGPSELIALIDYLSAAEHRR